MNSPAVVKVSVCSGPPQNESQTPLFVSLQHCVRDLSQGGRALGVIATALVQFERYCNVSVIVVDVVIGPLVAVTTT